MTRPRLCVRSVYYNGLDGSAQQALRAAAGSHESDGDDGYKGGRVALPGLDSQR